MSTATTLAALQAVRTRLLTFIPDVAPTLATQLGTATGAGSDGKLYLNQPPEDCAHPYGVLRLLDSRQFGFDGGTLLHIVAELILYSRPRSVQATVELMADTVQEAWHGYAATDIGGVLIADQETERMSIPYDDPADRDLVAIRLLLPFRFVPQFLSAHVTLS